MRAATRGPPLSNHLDVQSYDFRPVRSWGRNINLLGIGYSLRPPLSSRLTLGGRTFPRKPCPYGGTDFNRAYRYSCLDSHFQPLQSRLPLLLRCNWNAFLPLELALKVRGFGQGLSPDHLRRRLSRWVSYYALFKWWLPLSQHPHCLRKSTSLFPLSPCWGP